MNIADLIQLLLLLIAISTLTIVIYNFKQQLKESFFTDYTKRYQEIMLHLPEKYYTNEATYNELKDEAKAYLRAYFDLCSEEYFLKSTKKIDKDVWDNWKQGIVYAFKKKVVLEAWNHFNQENYKDFSEWINKEVITK
ncbi:MAG: hypothetical protein WCJ61_04775 [Paludibacter sp.]